MRETSLEALEYSPTKRSSVSTNGKLLASAKG
jgi:hypothetical protein